MTDGDIVGRWLAGGSERRWLFILTILLVALTLWLAEIGEPLKNAVAPQGIVSFELAGSRAAAAEMLASWGGAAREAAMLSLGVDFLYLLVYPAWLSLACRIYGGAVGGLWTKLGSLLSIGIFLAAPLDAVENLALIRQLEVGPSALAAGLASLMALPKFLLVILAAGYVLLTTLVLLFRRLAGR